MAILLSGCPSPPEKKPVGPATREMKIAAKPSPPVKAKP
jgi:hypothetical protein